MASAADPPVAPASVTTAAPANMSTQTGDAQNPALPPWSQIQSEYEVNNIPVEKQRVALQRWTNLAQQQLQNQDVSPEQKARDLTAFGGYVAQQYKDFEPGFLSGLGNVVKGVAEGVPAIAGSPLAVTSDLAYGAAGAPEDLSQFYTNQLGRGVETLGQQVQHLIPAAAQKFGQLTGSPGFNTGPTPDQIKDASFNTLKTRVSQGLPVDGDFLKNWGSALAKSSAAANNEDPATYNTPDRDPSSPENQQLIDLFQKTHDPVYADSLKANLTSSNVTKRVAKDQGQALSALPDWTQSVVQQIANPTNLAMAPLMLTGAGELAEGASLASKAAGGAATLGAFGAGQAVLENPQISAGDLAKATAQSAIVGGLLGGVGGKIGERFDGLKKADQAKALDALNINAEDFAKMSDMEKVSALSDAIRKPVVNNELKNVTPAVVAPPEAAPAAPIAAQPPTASASPEAIPAQPAPPPAPIPEAVEQAKIAPEVTQAVDQGKAATSGAPQGQIQPIAAQPAPALEVPAAPENPSLNIPATPKPEIAPPSAPKPVDALSDDIIANKKIPNSAKAGMQAQVLTQPESKPEETSNAIQIPKTESVPVQPASANSGEVAQGVRPAEGAAGIQPQGGVQAPNRGNPLQRGAPEGQVTPAKPIDALTTINTSRSAKATVPEGASHVRIVFPEGPKDLTVAKFQEGVNNGYYRGANAKELIPGKGVGKSFEPVEGDITVSPSGASVSSRIMRNAPPGLKGGQPGFLSMPEVPVEVAEKIQKGLGKVADAYERGDTNDQISAEKDAATQLSDIEARKQANDVRGPLSRAFPEYYTKGKKFVDSFLKYGKSAILPEDALTFLQETEANPNAVTDETLKNQPNLGLSKPDALAKLDEMAQKISASAKSDETGAWKDRALKAIEFAKENYDKLAPIADTADEKYAAQHNLENDKGLKSPYRQGYVFHQQDVEEPDGAPKFKMQRDYPTYADSIANGTKPLTLSAPDLLESRIRNGSRMLNNTAWVDGLARINDPVNKQPLTAKVESVVRPDGTSYDTVPDGYQKVTLGTRTVGIQKPYVKLVQTLTAPSAFEHEQLGRMLREGSQLKKSFMTVLDTYHLGWGAWRAMSAKLGSLDNPIPSFRTLQGRLALDFSPEEAKSMAAAGQIPQKWLDNLAERQRISQVMVKNGLLPGRGTDAIYQELSQKLPVLGGVNKYIFDGFIRSAINEISTREFQVQRKMFPDLSEEELARKVSGEVNNWMGNVGSRGIFKNKTFQDMARIGMLAPGLTEGKLRSEIGAPIQALQAIPQSIKAGRPAAGLYARATAASLLGAFTAAQLANLYFRGKPTWDNKEEGFDSKISGYLPDVIGGGPGLFYNPMEAAMPTISQLHDIYSRTGDVGQTMSQFARAKSGPLTAPLWDLGGTGPTGKPLKSGALSAAAGLIPVPITGGTLYDAGKQLITGKHSETTPGEFERQLASSFGVRLSNVPAPEQRIGKLAEDFKKANGITVQPTVGGSDFTDLNSALRTKNTQAAQDAMTALLAKRTPAQIADYFYGEPYRGFAGSRLMESKFVKTLTPEQANAYNNAVQDRVGRAKAAIGLLASQPNASPQIKNDLANFDSTAQVKQAQVEQSTEQAQRKDAIQSLAAQMKAAPMAQRPQLFQQALQNGTIPHDTAANLRMGIQSLLTAMQPTKDEQTKLLLDLKAPARAPELLKIARATPNDQIPQLYKQWEADKILTPAVAAEMAKQLQSK